jgi:hypothetical protein
MPQPWCITLQKTYTQLAEMNHELVLQIFCAHYGRHLPLSQACHAMLPGFSLYLLKSEPELDHTTNQSLVGIELRTWTGPYYQPISCWNWTWNLNWTILPISWTIQPSLQLNPNQTWFILQSFTLVPNQAFSPFFNFVMLKWWSFMRQFS